MGRFSKEVDEFVAAFKAGNDIGYRMRYFQLQQRQQQLREMQFQYRLQNQKRPDGLPADTDQLRDKGRELLHERYNENTTQPATTKQATVQPKKQEIPDATPTTQPTKSSDAEPAATTPSSGGGGSTGGEKRASILDRYPGSYQTAALETGTMNDASPVRSALGGVSAPGGATPKLARFDASKAPAYLDGIAQKYGIDPTDFKRMAWIESKFDPNARAGTSSAGGLFQFTDDTAKKYGLTNKFDGVANAEAAAKLWNDNKAGLTEALGRAPTAGELYLAHQQGLGGAKALLSNPNASAASLVGAKAVTNNGGNANMSARDFSNMWTGRFENVGHESGTTPAQSQNTRQQTAGSLFDNPLEAARSLMGKNETEHTDDIKKFLREGGHGYSVIDGHELDPRSKNDAWCAAYTGSALEHSGIKSLNSNVASDYLNWGAPVQGQVQPGDVVVQTKSRFGDGIVKPGDLGAHIGIATGNVKDGKIEILSGNSSNGVRTTWESADTAAVRRATENEMGRGFGSRGNDAGNTGQRTAADASSMSDANNDIRRTGGAVPTTATPAATTPSSVTSPVTPTSSAVPVPPTRPTSFGATNAPLPPTRPSSEISRMTLPEGAMKNYDAATTGMKLTPQEQFLYRYHLDNQYGTGGVNNPDGSRSTVYSSGMNINGREYMLPSVWDGQIHNDPNEIRSHAEKIGLEKFPSYATVDEAEKRYQDMHGYMEKDLQDLNKRPQQGPPMPAEPAKEAVPANAQPGQDALAPAAQQPAQSDGWSFLDDIGRGVDDFFNDLNIPADWDVGSASGDAGGDFGGIGDALGGIGDAIGGALGGLFNRGGMVR